MKTRLIRKCDMEALIALEGVDALMDSMIQRLEDSCMEYSTEQTELRVRDGFHYLKPRVGLVEWMPIMRRGAGVTVKMVGYHPDNPTLENAPTVLSTIGLWDTRTGHLQGLVDGVFLTALRTGAASAVASRVLARPDSTVLGLIGTGAQAVTQLHALLRCFPLQKVLIHDVDPAAQESFAARVAGFIPAGLEIREAPVDLLVQSADILCTATSIGAGCGPLFEDMNTRPGLHINAVGADLPDKTELPLALLRRAVVCPDYSEQAAQEGECQQLTPAEVGPDLIELVKNATRHEQLKECVTVFDSTGFALEDEAAMSMVLAHAKRHGLGEEIELEAALGDPLNPYDLGSGVCSQAVPNAQSKV